MFHSEVFNPAFAGKEDAIRVGALYRAQFVGIEGNPSSQVFHTDGLISGLNSGLGLTLVNDMIGVERTTTANLQYAYRIKLKTYTVSLGVQGGVFQRKMDGSKLRAPEGLYLGEGTINHNDQLIPTTTQTGLSGDAGAGLSIVSNKFYAGVSVTNLLENPSAISTPFAEAKIRQTRTTYFIAGYNITISNNLSYRPDLFVKTDFNNFQAELSNLLLFKENLWAGFAIRGYTKNSFDAVNLLFGFRLTQNLAINYSYDATVSGLRRHSSGSHEVGINYRINLSKSQEPGKVIYNPRFL